MARKALQATPVSQFDFPCSPLQRNERTASSICIHLKTRLPKLITQRRLMRFKPFKSTGIVGFSGMHGQIEQKTVPAPEIPLDFKDAELEVQTRIWNWRGYSVRYQYSGNNGAALVLVHGFGANSDHWRKNIPVLVKSHRVYSIDLIGYGYSDKPTPRQIRDDSFYTFETWAAQLNEFCVDVVKDEAFFVCNSVGGLVGLQAAVMGLQGHYPS